MFVTFEAQGELNPGYCFCRTSDSVVSKAGRVELRQYAENFLETKTDFDNSCAIASHRCKNIIESYGRDTDICTWDGISVRGLYGFVPDRQYAERTANDIDRSTGIIGRRGQGTERDFSKDRSVKSRILVDRARIFIGKTCSDQGQNVSLINI